MLDAPQVLRQFEKHWGRTNLNVGRPSIPMDTYVRLMPLKHSHQWGYQRLVARVSDSFQLRRFCRISITDDLPDESTLRKLTRCLGPELVDDLTRGVLKYPSDAWLAADAIKVLARTARKVQKLIPQVTAKVRDRSRGAGKLMRALGVSLRRRTGDAKEEVARLIRHSRRPVLTHPFRSTTAKSYRRP